MSVLKPWKSYQQQLDILKSRNMIISNETKALNCLKNIGYYRLSAYWYPFRVFELKVVENKGLVSLKHDEFMKNTCFEDAINLYKFDRKLRFILIEALELIEVSLKGNIAHVLGEKSPLAHYDISYFHPSFAKKKNNFENWQAKYLNLVDRSKEDFVKHYQENYQRELPIWVAAEIWDFGALSQLFSMMKVSDQNKIAALYGNVDFKVFSSWLRSINYLRNLVAHHSRLWNRNIIDQPKLPPEGYLDWCDDFRGKADLISKPFLLFSILRYLTLNCYPQSDWKDKMKDHLLNDFPELNCDSKVSVNDIGISENWHEWW